MSITIRQTTVHRHDNYPGCFHEFLLAQINDLFYPIHSYVCPSSVHYFNNFYMSPQILQINKKPTNQSQELTFGGFNALMFKVESVEVVKC